MGGSSSSCNYTNRGQTIGDIKDEINNNMVQYNDNKYSVFYDINNNYFPNLSKLYGDNNDSNIINKFPTVKDKVKLTLYNGSKSFNIDELYFKSSNPGIIEQIYNLNKTYESQITELNRIKSVLISQVKEKYGDINLNILNNDNKINDINKIKGNIITQTYSVSFFENLLIQSYKELYDAIYVENKVLLNNNSMKQDIYSTDNSKYTYETDKINFYENFNTFLFYFYYILIFISIIVIGIYNLNLLTTFSLFHILLLILILYPIYILKYQNFLYKYFERLLLYFKDSK